jgi:hypothetical protein
MTTAVMIAGSVTFTGGLAAIALKKIGVKNAPQPAPAQHKEDHHG